MSEFKADSNTRAMSEYNRRRSVAGNYRTLLGQNITNIGDNGALVNGTFKPADDAANADRTALLIIPERGFSGFTINYSFGGKDYSYTYADSNAPSTQGTVYSYKITMTLHEIQVVPTVTNWDTTIDEETPSVG